MNNQNGLNNMNMGYNNYNQPVQPNQNKKNSVLIYGSILGVLIIAVVVILILAATGKFKSDDDTSEKSGNKDKVTAKTDYSDVAALCDKRDEIGTYNTDALKDFFDAIMIDDNDSSWDMVRGKDLCLGLTCMVFTNDDSMTYYTYDCEDKTGETEKWNSLDLRAEFMLSVACSSINSKGNYADPGSDNTAVCENFVCSVTLGGKNYSSNCEH